VSATRKAKPTFAGSNPIGVGRFRLVLLRFSQRDACGAIAGAITECSHLLKRGERGEPCEEARFVAALRRLPELPYE